MTASPIDPSASDHLYLPIHTPTMPQRAAPLDWHSQGASEHVVQFYETDSFLVQTVSRFIGAGLASGESCIVIATPAHCAAFDAQLQAAGFDVVEAQASGQYYALDADETLAAILLAGSPASDRFVSVIGGLIAKARGARQRVRIFGEMVALLWIDGLYTAALRLEALWNDLLAAHTCTLLCAYPLHDFWTNDAAQAISDVCVCHTRVIPAESYTALPDADDRLRAIIELQYKAQMLEIEIAERKAAEAALHTMHATLEEYVAELQRIHALIIRLTGISN